MPIPFREAEGMDELGEAGFLKIDCCSGGTTYLGALLLINARGEPIEFTFSRVDVPHAALWRPSDARRFAARTLVISILPLCPRVPHVIFCLAEEMERELFSRDVQLSLPVCLVVPAGAPAMHNASTDPATPLTTRAASLSWIPDQPAEGSSAAQLLHELTSRSLVIEPFGRASRGLREVYGPIAGVETP